MFKYSQYNTNIFQVHTLVYNFIRAGSKVLDLGCATGYFGKELKQKSCLLYGVELNKNAAEIAKKLYKKIIISDLNKLNIKKLPKKYFDYVLLLDVVEHLTDIRQLFNKIQSVIVKNGKLIISTPNIAHISVRMRLLFGTFEYSKYGILDETHVHFYTIDSLINELKKYQLDDFSVMPSADFGQIPLFGRLLRHIPPIIQYYLTKLAPNLLAPQFIVICSFKR